LTQAEFAALFDVSVHTLRNWGQGRRAPEGPARAFLKVIEKEPEAALRALAAA
jgi:putative transcriptional regulator